MIENKLVLKNINHAYATKQSIKKICLTVEPGEIVCILGPSGAGKTTLLKLIAGFESPSSGEILIGNRILSGEKKSIPVEKRGVGMLFQDIALFPHLNVNENIGFALTSDKIGSKSKTVKKYLETINLLHIKDRYPHQISGGEQQRVALLRALAANPAAMLLDEPFSSLDVWTKFEVALEVISFLKKSNTPTLMVTHDPQEAMRLSDRILVMIEGKVIDEGTPNKLYSNPATPFSARISGPSTIIKSKSNKGVLETAFGEINLSKAEENKLYKIFIRPEAFHFTYEKNKGTNIKIKNLTNLGGYCLVNITIKNKKLIENVFLPSSIISDLENNAKLLFNQDWAFVFPI